MDNNKNLRPFPKGVSGNPNGRPRSLKRLIKEMPVEAQAEIYGVLYHAVSLPNKATARLYLERMRTEPVTAKYGVVFELAIESLMGDNGWSTLTDILERLFGKPRVSAEINTNIGGPVIIVDNQEQAEQIRHIGDLGV